MGFNKAFINILCCAHLLVCLSSVLLFLLIPSSEYTTFDIHSASSYNLLPFDSPFLNFHLYMLSYHVQPPPEVYSAYPAALALKESPAERRQMSQHLCAGFSSTSISTCFSSFFPVRYKTDHNSWPVSLLKLQSVVT